MAWTSIRLVGAMARGGEAIASRLADLLHERSTRTVRRMCPAICFGGLLLGILCASALDAEDRSPLFLVYAVANSADPPSATSIYAPDPRSGERHLLYRDAGRDIRISGGDRRRGAVPLGRAAPPGDVFVVAEPTSEGGPSACPTRLTRIRFAGSAAEPAAVPVLPLPLDIGEAPPAREPAKAPVFAVARDGRRFAFASSDTEGSVLRIVSSGGYEEWEIVLDHLPGRVADLAWSPDGKSLAFLLIPAGDEQAREGHRTPYAGLYVVQIDTGQPRLVHRCYADALAWGPGPDSITVAARPRGAQRTRHVLRRVALPSGMRVEEFSVEGSVSALSYSDDGQRLAVQSLKDDRQQIWLFQTSDGWGRRLYEVTEDEGRLSLLGWLQLDRREQ